MWHRPDRRGRLQVRGTRRALALGVVLCCVFTTAVDVTITNVALPAIADDLDATTGQLQRVVGAYNIVLAGLLLFGSGCLYAPMAGDPTALGSWSPRPPRW